MALQIGKVAMLALGVDADPALRSGVHLHWSVAPELGFPPLGFNVFRRTHATGPAQSVDFTAEQEGDLPQVFDRPPTHWVSPHPTSRPRVSEETTDQGTVRVVRPPVLTAFTCRFEPSVAPLCRLEIDVAHSAPATRLPSEVTAWGTAAGERIAQSTVRLTAANRGQVQTLGISGDAMDGLQIPDLGGLARSFGILRVRWARVADADSGWGPPLNARRIGLPVTAPGYLVVHAHGPDPGDGSQDWLEAADRMSPTGQAAQLPVALAQQLGPPVYAETRVLMRESLARHKIASSGGADGLPKAAVDATRLLLLCSVDADFARLLGLAGLDSTASAGQAYDYKVIGYWPGRMRPELVCTDVPGGGIPIPAGGTVVLPGAGGAPVTVLVSTPSSPGTTTTVQVGPTVILPPGVDLSTIPGLVVRRSGVVGWPPAGRELVAPPESARLVAIGPVTQTRPERKSYTFRFTEPTDVIRVRAASACPDPLVVVVLAGSTIVGVRLMPAGTMHEVTLDAHGATSVVVSGIEPTVVVICRIVLVQEIIEESWIAFDVRVGGAQGVAVPPAPSGRALRGFATEERPEQVVGLVFEPPTPPTEPTALLPLARRAQDPVAYDLERRAEGDQPVADPTAGPWEPLGGGGAGAPRKLLRGNMRPPAHRSPPGWPVDPLDFVDDGIDPDVRYHGYRIRAVDVFGRRGGWSAPASVDTADRVPPPAPASLTARWIELADPWLGADDKALLDSTNTLAGVRVRWGWPRPRRSQAPDTVAFRVYWHGRSFSTLTGTVTPLATVPAGHRARVALASLTAPPPADAFVGDWLRQGGVQHRITASSAASPTTLTLDPTGVVPPSPGEGIVSLRAPDPARLDLRGNPLRPDTTVPTAWERRVLQTGLVTLTGHVVGRSAGVAVSIAAVQPQAGIATVTLAATWRWAGELPDGLQLEVAGRRYDVVGGTVGVAATFLVRTDAASGAPATGPALLLATPGPATAPPLQTVEVDAAIPPTAGAALVGGALWDGKNALAVLAHAQGPSRFVVAAAPDGADVAWHPDYEALLTDVSLAVSDTVPHASGTVGVSAVDGRAYAADRRVRPGEPGGPGNEGPVSALGLTRDYRGAPTRRPAPDGTTGPAELWAPVPDPFSGTSRFPLRWPAAGEPAFVVEHATLDAVLDSATADRAAARGAYAGQPVLSGTAPAQWRTQQAALGPAGLQVLATQQVDAFHAVTTAPLSAADPALADGQAWLRWPVPLDGSAPGRHFLRVRAIDSAGNPGVVGPSTLPIVVPDARRARPPQLRRAIGEDRAVWLQWDASDAAGPVYLVYRASLAAGAAPDVRDMTLIATLSDTRCPEPVPVFAGKARLPGPVPQQLVGVYRAADYDPALAPGAQTATPVAGATLTKSTVGGLGALPDGSQVYCAVRHAAGAAPALAVSATGRAYRDATAAPGAAQQYRVVAERKAATGPGATVSVRSFPSEVGEAVAFDARRPVPPAAAAVWDAAAAAVKVTWTATGQPAALEVLPQRMDVDLEEWVGVGRWLPATPAEVLDAGVLSGRTYRYRVRVRLGDLTSDAEPELGPVTVP